MFSSLRQGAVRLVRAQGPAQLRLGRSLGRLGTGTVARAASASAGGGSGSGGGSDLIVRTTLNGVTTLRMNDPKRLNGWTEKMMRELFAAMQEAAADEDTKVAVVTGTDPYYCAGVNLGGTLRPMHPKKLFNLIVKNNEATFNAFIDFPKPIICAVNGPAIGASVTTATLSDTIIASEKATFSTPFHRLGIPPEGCSSVTFERVMGAERAERMLGSEGWAPTAEEFREAGFVSQVVPHDELQAAAQATAEQWIKDGKVRSLVEAGQVGELRAVNARESVELATAFLSEPFLQAQYDFLTSKGKDDAARLFYWLLKLRPAWKLLL